jgi:hypothetical protein
VPDPAPLHSPDTRSYHFYANQLTGTVHDMAVRFLLESVDDPTLPSRVEDRLRLSPIDPRDVNAATKVFENPAVPAGIARWLLERDDQDANFVAFHMMNTPEAVMRDILLGVPYGAGTGPIPVSRRFSGPPDSLDLHYRSFRMGHPSAVDDEGDTATRGLTDALYVYGAERRMKQVRHVAASIGARDWAAIGAADRTTPLPGYARWALCVHPACPPELRVQFGGTQPRHGKRMRNAGILFGGPSEYLRTGRNPTIVLTVLGFGGWLFPEQTAAARGELRPLVERELGGNLEAWAVLSRLLPQFSGSVPELIATSGAIAAGAGG